MPRLRVKVERGNGGTQSVVIDTDATRGGTLGTDVFTPNGQVGTPDTVRAWLGLGPAGTADFRNGYGIQITGSSPKTINVNRAAAFDWQGQHSWSLPLWLPNGTAALPAQTFTSDPNTGAYRVGADNYGISTAGVLRWDVNATRTLQAIPHYIAVPVLAPDTFYDVLKYYSALDATNGGFTLEFQDGAPTGDDLQVRMGFWNRGNVSTVPPASNTIGFVIDTIGHASAAADFVLRRYHGSTTPSTLMQALSNTDQLLFPQGAVGSPGWGFIGDSDTGIYSGTANTLRMSCGGTQVLGVTSTSFNPTVHLRAIDGSAGAPSLSFVSDTDNGLYYIGANSFGLSVGGTLRLTFATTGFTATVPWLGPNGAIGGPTFSFSGDPNTGMYNVGADQLGFATGGALRLTVNAAVSITSTLPFYAPNGAVGGPAYSFSGDPNTGAYSVGADQYGIAANGTLVAQFDADATAGNTRFMLYDVDNATLERVTVGVADSGGVGFKVLRIPN